MRASRGATDRPLPSCPVVRQSEPRIPSRVADVMSNSDRWPTRPGTLPRRPWTTDHPCRGPPRRKVIRPADPDERPYRIGELHFGAGGESPSGFHGPPIVLRHNRLVPTPHDSEAWPEWHLIENRFARIGDPPRVATRRDRCAETFPSACVLVDMVMLTVMMSQPGLDDNGEEPRT